MKKRILIGSILVLTLLLLMPSIPAIHQKTTVDKEFNDLIEQLDVKDVTDIRKIDWIRHPLLYALAIFIAKFRLERCRILAEISFDYSYWHGGPILEIHHPILFLRGLWLITTIEYWCSFWKTISNKFGWNWGDIRDIIYN